MNKPSHELIGVPHRRLAPGTTQRIIDRAMARLDVPGIVRNAVHEQFYTQTPSGELELDLSKIFRPDAAPRPSGPIEFDVNPQAIAQDAYNSVMAQSPDLFGLPTAE